MIFQYQNKKYTFMHIPKTGGIWFRDLIIGSEYFVEHGMGLHGQTLENAENNVVFTLRNPIDRFISALKYSKQDIFDSQRLNQCIKERLDVNISKKDFFDPCTDRWLANYLEHEHKVAKVFDFDNLKKSVVSFMPALSKNAHIDTPKNTTNIFDYEISDSNMQRLNEFYAKDFELYEYIKTRSYYASNES